MTEDAGEELWDQGEEYSEKGREPWGGGEGSLSRRLSQSHEAGAERDGVAAGKLMPGATRPPGLGPNGPQSLKGPYVLAFPLPLLQMREPRLREA